jgi:predicted transcriptional regulator
LHEGTWEEKQKGKSIRDSDEILVKTAGKRSDKSIRENNKQQERGNNWMSRITQKLERLGMGDIWKNGRNNNKEVWVRTRGRYVAIKGKILRLQSEREVHQHYAAV